MIVAECLQSPAASARDAPRTEEAIANIRRYSWDTSKCGPRRGCPLTVRTVEVDVAVA